MKTNRIVQIGPMIFEVKEVPDYVSNNQLVVAILHKNDMLEKKGGIAS